jgi:hypothetical protein
MVQTEAMKLSLPHIMVLAGATLSIAAQAQAEVPIPTTLRPVAPLLTSDQFLVNGEVAAKSDADFSVRDTAAGQTVTIQVSDETAITRGAATIALADLKVGEKVAVTVMRSANGRLVATKVIVRLPEEQ